MEKDTTVWSIFPANKKKHTWKGAEAGSEIPVQKEVLGQPLGPDDLKDDLIGFQGLPVDSTRQGRVEALGQPFAYRQLLGNNLIFCIVLQNLRRREHFRSVVKYDPYLQFQLDEEKSSR